MAKPFIIIGIGTTGLKVLEQVQHFNFENFGTPKPEQVELLYLETDKEGGKPKNKEWGKHLRRIFLDLSQKKTMINDLRERHDLNIKWLPDAVEQGDDTPGASGNPAFGRTALWGKTNFDEVVKAIRSAHTRLGSLSRKNVGEAQNLAVFVTGSLAGGTGSGTFIDIAYMLQKSLGIKDIYGLFLIPGLPGHGGYKRKDTIYCNTYAALKTIDYFSEPRKEGDATKYDMMWPDGNKATITESPYQFTQFITQDYSDIYPAIENLNGLIKIAGLYLFLNISGLFSKRNTRITDASEASKYGKYSTFGLAAIHYPSSQIDEYYSIQLSKKLLNRWIDTEQFETGGGSTKIGADAVLIKAAVNKHFEKTLVESFNLLDVVMIEANRQILNDMPLRALAINKHEIAEDISEAQYLYKLFAPGGTYYEAMRNNLLVGQDVLIRGIYNYIRNSVEKKESLYLAIAEVKYFGAAIIALFDYWKENHKVSTDPELWKRTLAGQIDWMLKGNYSLLGVQDEVLTDKMQSTLNLMKMHLMGKKIENIYNAMILGKTVERTDSGEELPSIRRLEKIISDVKRSIGHEDQVESNSNNLYSRETEIDADIHDETIPVLRIFPSGSFKREVEKINELYRQKHTSPSKSDIMGQSNLYEYLSTSDDTLSSRLFDDCTNKYVSIIKDLRTKEEMRNPEKGDQERWTIDRYIKENPNVAKEMASHALFPFVKINPNDQDYFVDYDSIPKVVISQSTEISKQVIKTLKDQNMEIYEGIDDHIFEIEGLSNMVVFFYERALMNQDQLFNPFKHLKYIDDIQRVYEGMYSSPNAKTTEKQFHIDKLPYIPFPKNQKSSEDK